MVQIPITAAYPIARNGHIDVFRAVINPNGPAFSPPFDDPANVLYHKRDRTGKVDHDAQTLAVNGRRACSAPKRQGIAKTSAIKSMGPVMFGASGTAKASGLSRLNLLRGVRHWT